MPRTTYTRNSIDLDAPVEGESTGENGQKHPLETAGVRANRNKIVQFELAGSEVYELCELLRKIAVDSQRYVEVATAVKFERLLFEQARSQGF